MDVEHLNRAFSQLKECGLSVEEISRSLRKFSFSTLTEEAWQIHKRTQKHCPQCGHKYPNSKCTYCRRYRGTTAKMVLWKEEKRKEIKDEVKVHYDFQNRRYLIGNKQNWIAVDEWHVERLK